MALPQMHGRTHLPAGYAALVQAYSSDAELVPQASSDQIRTIASSGASVQWVRATYSGVAQTINDNTLTNLSFDAVYESPGQTAWSVVNTGTNPFRVGLDGWYVQFLWINWNNTSFTDVREASCNPTGDGVGGNVGSIYLATSSPRTGEMTMTGIAGYEPVASSSTVNISYKAWQNSGSSKTVTRCHAAMLYLGAVADFFNVP